MFFKLKNNHIIQKIASFTQTKTFIAIPFLLALISNLFSLEIPVYFIILLMIGFICLFAKDTRGILPMFPAMYLATSRKNSPIISQNGIYTTFWVWVIIAIIISLFIFMLIHIWINHKQVNFNLKNNRFFYGILIIFLACIFNGVFSEFSSIKNLGFGLLFFVCLGYVYFYFSVSIDWNTMEKDYLFYIMIGMAILLILELMWIYISVEEIFLEGKIVKEKILTGWGIQNDLAGMLVITLPFIFYFAITKKHGWAYLLFSFIVVVALLFTLSRTSIYIGLLVFFIGCILFLIYQPKKLINLIIFLLIFLLSFLIIFFNFEKFSTMFSNLINIGLSLTGRDLIYKLGFEQFLQYPIFGVGFFAVSEEFMSYDIAFPILYHNMIIQFMASMGIVGIIGLVLHIITICKVGFKNCTREKQFILFAIFSLYAISLFDNHFFDLGPTLIYSMFICFLEKDIDIQRKKIDRI